MRRTNHDISFVSNHTSLGGQYELRVQEDYLIVLHARSPRCLLFPRHQTSEGDDFQARLGLSVEDSNDFPHLYGRRMPFDAIFGIYWLLKGPYLALVTESNVIGRGVDGKEIRQVTKIELMLIPTQNIPLLTLEQEEDERRYICMIRLDILLDQCPNTFHVLLRYIEMLTSDVDDHKLHFSYDYDLTHSLQRKFVE
jgi:hypothetical protein